MPGQHRAFAAFAFLALTSLLAPDQIQNDAAYTPVASGRMQPGTRVRGRFRKPSDVPVNTQQEANAGDIVLACSELATLAGENPFKDAADGWRRVIRNNFKPTYKKLVGQAPEMLSREELASQELQRLPIAEKMKLQQFQETAVKKTKSVDAREEAKKEVPQISARVAELVQSRINKRRGGINEKRGLQLVENLANAEAEQVESEIVQLEGHLRDTAELAMLSRMQSDDIAYLEAVFELTSRLEPRERGIITLAESQELLREQKDILANTRVELQAVLEKQSAKVEAEVEKLSKSARELRAPLQPGNKKTFTGLIAPGLHLRGKIDAHRNVNDEVHIFEHKARQRKLLKTVPMNERIQCLGYMDLVQREHEASCAVRCFLVETMQGETWQQEIKPKPMLWQQVVGNVYKQACQLKQLMQSNANVHEVLDWLDSTKSYVPCRVNC